MCTRRVVELPLYLLLAWYFGQVVGTGTGSQRHPLFFLGWQNTPDDDVSTTLAASHQGTSQPQRQHTTSALGHWHLFADRKVHPSADGQPLKVCLTFWDVEYVWAREPAAWRPPAAAPLKAMGPKDMAIPICSSTYHD